MVRLVFRPYTQISRSICTSESFRASTRVSPGFTLFRHSSPSFGYHHVCWAQIGHVFQSADGAISCLHDMTHHSSLSLRIMVCNTIILTHMLDSLVRVSRRDVYSAILYKHRYTRRACSRDCGMHKCNPTKPRTSRTTIYPHKVLYSCTYVTRLRPTHKTQTHHTHKTYTSLLTVSGTF